MAEAFFSASWYRVSSLRPVLREHAQIHRHRYRSEIWYVLQDWASGRMHRFTPTVYYCIGLMDGMRTTDQIWRMAGDRFGAEAPSQEEIVTLLAQLHAADLLRSDAAPDTLELFERSAKHRRNLAKRNLLNPLAIRIPLIDPDRFLARTLALIRPFYGRMGFLIWFATVGYAVLLAAAHWPELTENLSDRVLSIDNLFVLFLLFPIVKAFHELGHAYATKIGGGEVHDLGLMLLVFSPVPYVDASAATAFRSKLDRAVVGAAGMMVEAFLAALAMFIWVLVEPGMVRSLAFNIMLIAGVSTVLFNGNPLLRFDGYYILSDLLEIPNLGTRANRYLGYLIEKHVFRAPDLDPFAATPGEKAWFVCYAPAAFVYRLLVQFAIALFVASEFFVIGVLIAIWGLATGVVWPAAKVLIHVVANPRLRRVRLRAVSVTAAAVLAFTLALVSLPMPSRTRAEGVVWVPERAQVRAQADGFVRRILVAPGEPVQPGDVLLESHNPDLATEILVLEAKVKELETRLSSELFSDRTQADITREELEEQRGSLARAVERAEQLAVRSGTAGVLVIPRAEDLPGRYFHKGEHLGYVAEPDTRIVRVVVGQEDIDLVRQRLLGVDVKLPGRLEESISGRVVREVPAATNELPSPALGIGGGGRVAVDFRDESGLKSLARIFQFDIELPETLKALPLGMRVYVRFDHTREPLATQWYRQIRQLFLSELDV